MTALLTLTATVAAALAAMAALLLLVRQGRAITTLRLLGEQNLANTRAEAETTRAALRAADTATAERLATLCGAQATGIEQVRTVLSREQGELRLALADTQQKTADRIAAQFETTRTMIEAKLRELREGNEAKLAEIQKTVNEQFDAIEYLYEAILRVGGRIPEPEAENLVWTLACYLCCRLCEDRFRSFC